MSAAGCLPALLLRTASVLLLATGCTHAPPAAVAAQHPAPLYRLDFVVATNEAGGASTRSTYTMNVEDRHAGQLHAGANVQLAPGGPRQDVGIRIRCDLGAEGSDLVLHGETEVSALGANASVHKISVRGASLLKPGASAVIARLDEPSTHAHYDVTVTATPLR